MKDLKCCFIGHRNIDINENFEERLKNLVEDLILNKNVRIFLFGSRSEFNTLCHVVVSALKEKYPFIKRIVYTCKSESCTLEENKKEWEEIFSHFNMNDIYIMTFEEEFEFKTKYTAGRASYVERNQALINDSDYCIFYFNKDYYPKSKIQTKSILKKPTSGTKIAIDYAAVKKKNIINVYDKL